MGLLENTVILNIFGIILALFLIFYVYFKWSYQYWKRRNIPSLEPVIPNGNIPNMLNPPVSISDHFRQLYTEIKEKGLKYCGYYWLSTPHLFITDLDLLKNIMTKDFQNFADRQEYVNEKDDPLSAHLFAVGGSKWRHLRTKMSPTFTSGKMKIMFQTLAATSNILKKHLLDVSQENKPLNIKDILVKYTTDIIGSCAFGLECNSFKDPDAVFAVNALKVTNPPVLRTFLLYFAISFPKLSRFFGVLPNEPAPVNFYRKIVNDTVEYRTKNNITRKDFLQMLIELKKNEELTLDEIAAQCFVFFLAGFETSSTTMTFALLELSRNQAVQTKLREEINEVLKNHNNEITYDAISEMKYLDQVFNETLRMYPPLPFVNRVCGEDYKYNDLLIKKGEVVDIPIVGIHYDPEYYDNPEKFNPEHFSEANKANRHNYAHIPFGEGPRICIGMRFGIMQSKMGLATIIRNFKVTLNGKTKTPIRLNPNIFFPAVEGDVWLNLSKI